LPRRSTSDGSIYVIFESGGEKFFVEQV